MGELKDIRCPKCGGKVGAHQDIFTGMWFARCAACKFELNPVLAPDVKTLVEWIRKGDERCATK